MNRNWVVTLTYDLDPSMAAMDSWEDQLAEHEAVVARVPGQGITVAVHADDTTVDDALAQARTCAAATIDAEPTGIEVITEEEHQNRAGPDLMSAAEIADALQISRQRVYQLRSTDAFPPPLAELRNGAVWDARVIRQFAAEWARRPGRPPMPGTWAVVYERLFNGAWQQMTEERHTQAEALELCRRLQSNPDIREARLLSTSSD